MRVNCIFNSSPAMILNCKATMMVHRAPHLSPSKLVRCHGVPSSRVHHCNRGACEEARHLCQASGQNGEDVVDSNRARQLQGSELLMKLLDAEDVRKTAVELAPQMGEDFFMVGSAYMDMAKKDKQLEVAANIEAALKVAMEEKSKTLRPEIRLLNELVAQKDSVQRKRILNSKSAGEALQMNEGYFFILLSQFTSDISGQADNPGKKELLERLQEIEYETLSRASASKGFGSKA